MAATLNPSISATLKTQRLSAGAAGTSVSEVWIVPSGGVTAFEALWPIGQAHGTITTATLITRNRESIDGDSGSTVAYKYDLAFSPTTGAMNGGWGSPGEEVVEGSSNATDIPIEKHPTLTDVQKAALLATGVDSYLSPQPVFIHREYDSASTFDFSEAELIADVGKIADTGTLAAAGLNDPSSGKWLLVDRAIRYNGDTVEISRTWQYAANGWDTNIYLTE